MSGKVFVVEPGENVISLMVQDVLEGERPGDEVILFPHRRAVAFCRYYFSKSGRKGILPKIFAFEDWVKEAYLEAGGVPKRLLTEFDQAWLTYRAYKEVSKRNVSWEVFLPWGVRLARLFREFDFELVDPKNFYPSLVSDGGRLAEEILERLRDIYEGFLGLLDELEATTYARMARWVAEEAEFAEGYRYRIAGFYALTRAESRIFKRLFDAGAYIYWQADSSRLPVFYQRWKREWRLQDSQMEVVGERRETSIRFFEGYNLHSELSLLREELSSIENVDAPDKVALVLLDQRNLLPLLYSLPQVEVNVTMGYPLYLTSLFSLVGILRELVVGKREDGLYPSRFVASLLGHPYLGGKPCRFDAPFVGSEEMGELYTKLVKPFEDARTPEELARALESLVEVVLDRAGELEPVEKGFLVKLVEDVIPALREGLYSKEPLGSKRLFLLLEGMLKSLTIPFEGEPLKGLQVMGLLETRLLSFDEVYILDANEGILPSAEEVNPLAPQLVLEKLGLPDRIREEKVTQYHFERLISSARRANIFWQTQITPERDGFEGKKVRSRFVERLIWNVERKKGSLFEEVKVKELEIKPEALRTPALLSKDGLEDRIKALLREKGISQSMLNTYLKCPLSFYYRYLMNLEGYSDSREIAPDEVGSAMHDALMEYYSVFKGRVVRREELSPEEILRRFDERLKGMDFYKYASPQRLYLLRKGVEERIKRFVRKQPSKTKIVELESMLECVFEVDSEHYRLLGYADRIDERSGVVWILDYKTGRTPEAKFKKEFSASGLDLDHDGLREIYKNIGDLQLPFYIYVAAKDGRFSSPAFNAAYVDLYKTGEEKSYIGKRDKIEDLMKWVGEEFEGILEYLIEHMLHSPYWYPAVDSAVCQWCGYKNICRFG